MAKQPPQGGQPAYPTYGNQASNSGAKFDESIGLRLVVDFNSWIAGLQKSEEAINSFGDVVSQIASTIPREFEHAQRKFEGIVNGIVGGVNKVRNVFLKWEAGLAATTLAMAHHSAGLERSMFMMERLAERTGKSVSGVYKVVEQNLGGVANKADLVRASIHMMNTEFNPAQMDKFVKIVKDASAAMGTDFSHSMEFAVKSVQTLNTGLLTNIGLVIRQEEVMSKAAQQNVGIAAEQLTPQMKQTALLSLIQERSKRFEGSHEQLMGRGTYQWSDFKQNLSDISEELGRVFIPAWARAAAILTHFTGILKSIVQNQWFQSIGKFIAAILIPAITIGAAAFTALSAVLVALKPIIIAIPFLGLAVGINRIIAALRGPAGMTGALKEMGTVLDKVWTGSWRLMWDGSKQVLNTVKSFRSEFKNIKEWGDQAKGRSTFASLMGTTPAEIGLIDRGRKKLGEDWKKTVEDFRKQRSSISKEFGTSPIQALMIGGSAKDLKSKEVWDKFQKEAEDKARAASGGRLTQEANERIQYARDTGQKAGEAFVIAQSSAGKKWRDTYGLQKGISATDPTQDMQRRIKAGELDPSKISGVIPGMTATKAPAPDFRKVFDTTGFKNQAKALGDEIKLGMKYVTQGFMFEDGAKALGMSMKKGIVGNVSAALSSVVSAFTNTGGKLRGIATTFNSIFKSMFTVGLGTAIYEGLKSMAMFAAKMGGMLIAFEVIGALYQRMKDWQTEKKFGSKEIEEESKQIQEKYDQLNKEIRKRKEQAELTKGTNFIPTEEIKSELVRTQGRMTVEQIRAMAAPGMSEKEIEAARSKRGWTQLANTGWGLVQGAMDFVGADEAAASYKGKIKRNEREIARLGVNWEAHEGASELKKNAENIEAMKNLNTSSMLLSDTTKILNKNFREYLQAEGGATPIMAAVTNMIRERIAAYSDLIIRAREYQKWKEKFDKEPAVVQEAVTKKYVAQRLMQPGAKETPEEVQFAGTAEDLFSNKPGEYRYRAVGSTKWRDANATGISGGAPGFARRREGVADTPAMKFISMTEEMQQKTWEILNENQRNLITEELKRIKEFAPQAQYQNTQNSVEFQKSIDEARTSIRSKVMKEVGLDLVNIPSVASFKKDDSVFLKAQSLAEMSVTESMKTPEGQALIKEQGGEKKARAARLQGYLEEEGRKKQEAWISERTPEVRGKIEEANRKIEKDVAAVEQRLINSLKPGVAEAGRDAAIAFADAFDKQLSDKKNLPVVTANMLGEFKALINKIETAQGLQDIDLQSFNKSVTTLMDQWIKAYDTHTNMLKKHVQALLGVYATERRIADSITKAPRAGATSVTDIEHAQKSFSLDAMDKELLHASLLWENMTVKAAAFTQVVATLGQKGINTPTLEKLKQQYDAIQTDFESLTTQFNGLFDKALEAQKNLINSYTTLKKEQAGYNDALRESNSRITDASRQITTLQRELRLLPTPGSTGKIDVEQMKNQAAQKVGTGRDMVDTETEALKIQFEETKKLSSNLYTQASQAAYGSAVSPQDALSTIKAALDAVHKEFESVIKMTTSGDRYMRADAMNTLQQLGNRGYEENKVKELNRMLEDQNEKMLKARIRGAEIEKEAAQLELQLFQDQYELRKAQLELEVERQKREIDIILMWRNKSEQDLANMTILMKLQAALAPSNTDLKKVMDEAEIKQKQMKVDNEAAAAAAIVSRAAGDKLIDKIRVLMDNVARSEAEVRDAQIRKRNVEAGKSERDNLSTGMEVFPERRDANAPAKSSTPQVLEYTIGGEKRTLGKVTSRDETGPPAGGAFTSIPSGTEGAASTKDKEQQALQEKMRLKGLLEKAQKELPPELLSALQNAKTAEERLAAVKKLPPGFEDLGKAITPMDEKGNALNPNVEMAKIFNETVNTFPPMMQKAIEDAFGGLKEGLDIWMRVDKGLLEKVLGIKIIEPEKAKLSTDDATSAAKAALKTPEQTQQEFMDRFTGKLDVLSEQFVRVGDAVVGAHKTPVEVTVRQESNLLAPWYVKANPDRFGDVGRQ